MLAAVTLGVLAVLFVFQKEILFHTFDAHLAEVSGLNTALYHYLLLLVLVLTVVITVDAARKWVEILRTPERRKGLVLSG